MAKVEMMMPAPRSPQFWEDPAQTRKDGVLRIPLPGIALRICVEPSHPKGDGSVGARPENLHMLEAAARHSFPTTRHFTYPYAKGHLCRRIYAKQRKSVFCGIFLEVSAKRQLQRAPLLPLTTHRSHVVNSTPHETMAVDLKA